MNPLGSSFHAVIEAGCHDTVLADCAAECGGEVRYGRSIGCNYGSIAYEYVDGGGIFLAVFVCGLE